MNTLKKLSMGMVLGVLALWIRVGLRRPKYSGSPCRTSAP